MRIRLFCLAFVLVTSFYFCWGNGMSLGSEMIKYSDSLLPLGDFAEAEAALFQAQELFQKGNDQYGYVSTFPRLVRLYELWDRRNLQLKAILTGLTECKIHLQPQQDLEGALIMMHAEYLLGEGNYELVASKFHQAMDILKTSKSYEDYVWCHCNMAVYHYTQVQLDSALFYLDQGQNVCMQFQPDHLDARYTLLDLKSMVYSRKGQYHSARDMALQSMNLQLESFNPTPSDSLELGNTLNSVASMYFLLGDLPEAISYFQRALSFHQYNSLFPNVAIGRILNNLAISFRRNGQFELYSNVLQKAQEYLQEPTYLQVAKEAYVNRCNLTELNLDIADWDQAKTFANEAISIALQWGFHLGIPYHYQGRTLAAVGAQLEAIELFRQSLQEYITKSPQQKPQMGLNHLWIGHSFMALEMTDSALSHFHQAVNYYAYDFESSVLTDNPGLDGYFPDWHILEALLEKGNCFRELAFQDLNQPKIKTKGPQVLFSQNLLSEAFASYTIGIQIFRKIREGYQTVESRIGLANIGRLLYSRAVLVLLDQYETFQNPELLEKAFSLTEGSRAIALLETQWKSQAKGASILPSHLREEEHQLEIEVAFYQSQVLKEENKKEATDSVRLINFQNLLFEKERELDEWERQIQPSFPQYFSQKFREREVTSQQVIDSLLQEGELFIEYHLTNDELITYTITEDGLRHHRTPVNNDLETLLNQFLRCLSDYRYVHDSVEASWNSFRETGHALYQFLLETPLQDYPSADQLLILPDGKLHQIPFEALITQNNTMNHVDYSSLPYLIRQKITRYGYSAALLLEIQGRENREFKKECLAFAPDYEEEGSPNTVGTLAQIWDGQQHLPGAQKEVRILADLGFTGDFLTGPYATEDQFKTLHQGYSILHLAMHGSSEYGGHSMPELYFTETPLDSCEDDRLQIHELATMHMEPELVFLSACESGKGKYLQGEGIMSLGRSFVAAGARSVVMTLWQVDDVASRDLTRSFYSHLKKGLSTSAALHKAKIDFLKNSDSRLAHPYYWASFVTIGNSIPVNSTSGNAWWIAWFILVSLLLFKLLKSRN